MEKEKGLFSGLRSRRSAKAAINLDDEQQTKDDMIYQVEALDVHVTRWKVQECSRSCT